METIVDLNFLKTFTNGNEVKMSKYINMFLNSAPSQLEEMEKQINNNDWDGFSRSAHSFKPQVTYMGIKNLEETMLNLEFYSREKVNTDKIPALFNELKSGCADAFEELKKELKQITQ